MDFEGVAGEGEGDSVLAATDHVGNVIECGAQLPGAHAAGLFGFVHTIVGLAINKKTAVTVAKTHDSLLRRAPIINR